MSEVMDAVEVALADLFRSLYAFPDDDAQSVAAMARERVYPIVEAEASRLQDALSHLEKVNMELSSAVRRYREQAELDIRHHLEERRHLLNQLTQSAGALTELELKNEDLEIQNRRYREALDDLMELCRGTRHGKVTLDGEVVYKRCKAAILGESKNA